MRILILLLCALLAAAAPPAAPGPEDYRADARSLEALIAAHYAYPERFEGGRPPISARLKAEAEAVSDRRALLLHAERVLLSLADHHAIMGASTPSSPPVVPTFADLWIERRGDAYAIDAVRQGSPAAAAGIRAGDRLAAIDGVATEAAVERFWADLGLPVTAERAGFAARLLAAGGRDRARRLTLTGGRTVELPSLYQLDRPQRPPLTASEEAGALVVRIHDSLGDEATIAAFDAAMARAKPRRPVVIDLTDTPSGGNTVVARAMLGWFVDAPRAYQVHRLPAEERRTGIPRQWIEQVLPREGKRHRGPVSVRVGRWTGSMGEGLAIGFDAIGARVEGGPMAGLLGAIYDHRLERSGLVVKLPTERLSHIDGTPRERFVPRERRR